MPHLSPTLGDVSDPLSRLRSDYLLVCQAQSTHLDDGRWQFSLETADGTPVLEASDDEIGDLNRLTLLAAVRGLEAIEGPASVTLLSNNRYLIRSLTDSLPRWRSNDFVWEHFGRRIDIQHADLWRRIDRALQIHRVEACLMTSRLISDGQLSGGEKSVAAVSPERLSWRVDAAHPSPPSPHAPSDRLRSWLLGGGACVGATTRRRFTSADLLGAS